MFLADYHIHSTCSFDAFNTMTEMAEAARNRGIGQLCFTDHLDFDIPETLQIGDDLTLPAEQAGQYADALAGTGMDIRLGLELGEGNHDAARALAIYAMPDYDFILGSLHNLRDTPDFYYLQYTDEDYCYWLYERYLDELLELSALNCFDTLAHLGYCRRYMAKQGQSAAVTMERHGDKVDAILRTLIAGGRGIELNCADLVPGGREDPLLETFPSVPILRRYRELGGEYITVGSDAHTTRAAGVGVEAGFALLRDCGFRYVTTYRKHLPEMIKL